MTAGEPSPGSEFIVYGLDGIRFFVVYGLPTIFILALLAVIAMIHKGRQRKKTLETFGIKPKQER